MSDKDIQPYRHVGDQELIADPLGRWVRLVDHKRVVEGLLDEHEETYRAQSAQIVRERKRADKWESAYKDRTRELDFATERAAQLEHNVVSRMATVLTRALDADKDAVEELFGHRVDCNQKLADDPDVMVRAHAEGNFSVGLLGLINGLLGGDEIICIECNEYDPERGLLDIVEFKVAHKAQFQHGFREVQGECPVCGGDEYLQPCPKCGGLEP